MLLERYARIEQSPFRADIDDSTRHVAVVPAVRSKGGEHLPARQHIERNERHVAAPPAGPLSFRRHREARLPAEDHHRAGGGRLVHGAKYALRSAIRIACRLASFLT